MVYTVTFNPALDYSLTVDRLIFGETNRSVYENITFGGKGINVSVILNRLGVNNTALGFIAGFTGTELENRLNEIGIYTDFVKLVKGITRINVKLKADTETEINATGPEIDNSALQKLFIKIKALKRGDTLVLSGSVPKNVSADIYEQIMQLVKEREIKVCVDATGDLLLNTLKYKPFVIKPNKAELEELFGAKFNTMDEIVSAANKLKSKGALNVLVSLGADGAVLLDEYNNVHYENAKKILPINTVGSGDSMLAGFIAGAEKGYEYALKLGIAAGSATAANVGIATKDEIFSLLNTKL